MQQVELQIHYDGAQWIGTFPEIEGFAAVEYNRQGVVDNAQRWMDGYGSQAHYNGEPIEVVPVEAP